MGKLKHMDILLSFFTPYPHTKLYDASVKNGLKPLNTLEIGVTLTSLISKHHGFHMSILILPGFQGRYANELRVGLRNGASFMRELLKGWRKFE